MINNIAKITKSYIWFIWIIIGILIISMPAYYFMEKDLIIWNLGYSFYLTEVTLTIVISILFWLFIWATFYKINYFSIKKSWIWILGWFLWALVSWCPACSITLASYLWLASFMYLLPYSWLELKILSVLILLYANYSTIKNLEVCKIKV